MLLKFQLVKVGNVGRYVTALSDLRIWWPRFKMLASSQHYFCSPVHSHLSLPSVKKTKNVFQSWQHPLLISAFAFLGATLLGCRKHTSPSSNGHSEKLPGPDLFPVEARTDPWLSRIDFWRQEHDDKPWGFHLPLSASLGRHSWNYQGPSVSV